MTYPLFIMTGISGSGKSATSLELQKIMVDFNELIWILSLTMTIIKQHVIIG
ncbi:hypothetical protein J7E52_18260 [Bacillus sp. ISL-34]|uniref:hypothetical protein n=1 Tax=Bacillus sp. ISL-34 TaxID=2819121 RepID=UPI001BEA565A|nr:hypothetical protein [Bacillus sp. ISL-34]MBT2648617.1 hypothetical protein [Bacillus sp. ISL-34]